MISFDIPKRRERHHESLNMRLPLFATVTKVLPTCCFATLDSGADVFVTLTAFSRADAGRLWSQAPAVGTRLGVILEREQRGRNLTAWKAWRAEPEAVNVTVIDE